MMRHMGDLGLVALPVGDVLVGGQAAAVRQRMMQDGNHATVAELPQFKRTAAMASDIFVEPRSVIGTIGAAIFQDLSQ